MKFENHQEFFKCVGDHGLHPTSFGEGIYSISVEEMYQHFKARLFAELMASMTAQEDEESE
jgi:hypothetical protein